MDEATQRQWEAWANALVQKKLEALAEVMGAEVSELLKHIDEKIAKLEAEIDILRSYNAKKITPLRAHHVA